MPKHFYLVNPPEKRGKGMARRRGRKRRTAAQRRATARMIAANRARRRSKAGPKRRQWKVTGTYGRRALTVARRKRTTRRRGASRRRRRSGGSINLRRVRGAVYKRNPPIMRALTRGVQDAVAVAGGKIGTRLVSGFLPLPQDGMMGIAVQVGTGLAVGIAANQFLSADVARFVMAGALSAPIESVLRQVPVIGPMLSGDEALGAYELGAYELGGDEAMGELPLGAYDMGEEVYS